MSWLTLSDCFFEILPLPNRMQYYSIDLVFIQRTTYSIYIFWECVGGAQGIYLCGWNIFEEAQRWLLAFPDVAKLQSSKPLSIICCPQWFLHWEVTTWWVKVDWLLHFGVRTNAHLCLCAQFCHYLSFCLCKLLHARYFCSVVEALKTIAAFCMSEYNGCFFVWNVGLDFGKLTAFVDCNIEQSCMALVFVNISTPMSVNCQYYWFCLLMYCVR